MCGSQTHRNPQTCHQAGPKPNQTMMDKSLGKMKISSLNTNGIRERHGTAAFRNMMRTQGIDVSLLQGTYVDGDTADEFADDWPVSGGPSMIRTSVCSRDIDRSEKLEWIKVHIRANGPDPARTPRRRSYLFRQRTKRDFGRDGGFQLETEQNIFCVIPCWSTDQRLVCD